MISDHRGMGLSYMDLPYAFKPGMSWEENASAFSQLTLDQKHDFLDRMYDAARKSIIWWREDKEEKEVNLNYQQFYEKLMRKCENDDLTILEQKVFADIAVYDIIRNNEIDNILFQKFMMKYRFNKKENICAEDIILLLKYQHLYMNQYYNTDISLNMIYDKDAPLASCQMGKETTRIQFNTAYYENIFEYEITQKSLTSIVIVQTYAFLHEYRHVNQHIHASKKDDDVAKKIIKENLIINWETDFYKKYHDCFFIERDANDYAFDHVEFFLEKMIQKDAINEWKKIYLKRQKNLLHKIAALGFNNLFDKKYRNIEREYPSEMEEAREAFFGENSRKKK